MRVVICDRCGVTITYLGDNIPAGNWMTLSMGDGAEYDLCDECGPELMEFMHEKRVSE